MLQLGILDQSPLMSGQTAAQSLQQTLQLAQAADRLGFSRYWVSEHHAMAGLSGSAPEILVAALGGHTKRIRIGSGGVLLPHYSPYKVAETFRLLEGLYPNRVDLGIGRAAGGPPAVSNPLRYGRPLKHMDHFLEMLNELGGFLTDGFEEGHRYRHIRATPLVNTMPECWLLGSSSFSGNMAAQSGAAFSFAHFIAGEGQEAIHRYNKQYRPGPLGSEPRANVCVIVVCAETDEEAENLSASMELALLWAGQGQFDRSFPSPDEARRYPYTASERESRQLNRSRMIVGRRDKVKRELVALAQSYGVQELIVLTAVHDFNARLRSYEMLAEMFSLKHG